MDIGVFQSIWTLVVLVIGIGVTWWAYAPSHKAKFDAAAHIPLEDDDNPRKPPAPEHPHD
jgi:cbb3-type cytochrome oxidase subunit 3